MLNTLFTYFRQDVARPLQHGWAVVERLGTAILAALAWVGEVFLFGFRRCWSQAASAPGSARSLAP